MCMHINLLSMSSSVLAVPPQRRPGGCGVGGALGQSHPCCAPEQEGRGKVSQQPGVADSGKDCVAFHGVIHTHVNTHANI